MRLLLALLLLVSMAADAAVRRLSECGTLPETISESAPFDLDACSLVNGDDITLLLTDIGVEWGAVYVRAPSNTKSVIAKTTLWASQSPAIKTFVFLEDQSRRNVLTIQHTVDTVTDTYTQGTGGTCYKSAVLWSFTNPTYVKIGGTNLSLTLVGTHPGLATGDYITTPHEAPTPIHCENQGFIEAFVTDDSSPDLLDVRANLKFTERYSIYTYNDTSGDPGEGVTTNRIKQLNVAGLHYATSGVFFHQGVQHAWADPDRFVLSDPYVRAYGWLGTVGTQTDGGLPVGCVSQAVDQLRFAGFSGYYTDSITGGMTLEYGIHNWVQRFDNRVGVSANEPFIVRIKDWGISGPGSPQAGVRVKWTAEANIFKGDAHWRGTSGVVRRWVRFQKLPDTYGSGPSAMTGEGCVSGDIFNPGNANFARLENSTALPNRDWHITFSGNWLWSHGSYPLLLFAWDAGESYGHTMRLASGTTIDDTITLHDRDTVTGSGTFAALTVSDYSAAAPGRGNAITNTHVSGVVTIDADTETTVISNVDFTGTATDLITVGSGSTASISNLCIASGKRVTGAGTVTYGGAPLTLPHTFAALNECVITADGTPNPPTGTE